MSRRPRKKFTIGYGGYHYHSAEGMTCRSAR